MKRIKLPTRIRKQNICIPLKPVTLETLDRVGEEMGSTRTEVARYAIEFALKNKKFLDILKELS